VRLLDLFSCAGGAGTGYARAGFEVVGNDIVPRPRYPFEFIQGDALDVLDTLLAGGAVGGYTAGDFAAVHASPPCQGYTALAAVHGNEWPLLIEPVRDRLDALGLPYIIENVQGAPIRRDVILCGEMFGLRVIRHRYFELGGWVMLQPQHIAHRGRVGGWRHGERFDGPYFAVYGEGGGKGSVAEWQDAMGIHWTDDRIELAEAIPPAYTQLLGAELLAFIGDPVTHVAEEAGR
jgi:hypothetical protein